MAQAQAVQPPRSRAPSLLARIVGANSKLQMQEAIEGYLFALPWILGLIIFFGGPIVASMVLSFTEYDMGVFKMSWS